MLYAAVAAVIVTHAGDDWPHWLFWTGVGLALAAGGLYAGGAARAVQRSRKAVSR